MTEGYMLWVREVPMASMVPTPADPEDERHGSVTEWLILGLQINAFWRMVVRFDSLQCLSLCWSLLFNSFTYTSVRFLASQSTIKARSQTPKASNNNSRKTKANQHLLTNIRQEFPSYKKRYKTNTSPTGFRTKTNIKQPKKDHI